MAREPVPPTQRKAMTKARRARILAKWGGKCAALGCEEAAALEIDHFIPVEIGGKDDDANLQPLCRAHHAAKTRLDIKMIAKARRMRKAEDPKRESSPSRIRSRGFDRKFRRKFNGQVELRQK